MLNIFGSIYIVDVVQQRRADRVFLCWFPHNLYGSCVPTVCCCGETDRKNYRTKWWRMSNSDKSFLFPLEVAKNMRVFLFRRSEIVKTNWRKKPQNIVGWPSSAHSIPNHATPFTFRSVTIKAQYLHKQRPRFFCSKFPKLLLETHLKRQTRPMH